MSTRFFEMPSDWAVEDRARVARYAANEAFAGGEQWSGKARRGETRLTLNYARALIRKTASYCFPAPVRFSVESAENADAASRAERVLNELADRLDPYAYVAVGRYLYRTVALSASSWSAFTQVADVGAGKTITRLALYQGGIALCCGNGLDVQFYAPGTGTVTTLSAGLKARVAVGYANRLVYGDPAAVSEQILRMTTGGTADSRELDAPIVNMGLHDGKVAIATRQSLWLLGGRPDPVTNKWNAEPQPFFTHGVWTDDEDFLFLLSYGGKLYTWLANGVMEWNPNGDKAGWNATGIEGRSCTGATVAGDRLIVCIVNRAGESESWAFDGSGWWLMVRSSSQTRVWWLVCCFTSSHTISALHDCPVTIA